MDTLTIITLFDMLFGSAGLGAVLEFVKESPLAAGIFALGTLLLLFSLYRAVFWIRQGNKLSTPGYLTPRVTLISRIVRCCSSRLLVFTRVGRLLVLNREHLNYPGRLIIVPNHVIEKDAVVVPAVLRLLYFRGLMAITQIVGLRKPLAAWQGTIPVHHDRNPRAAVTAALRALEAEKESSLLIFPQGRLVRDNALRREDFFAGAILIGKKAQKKSELPIAFLPVGLHYDRNRDHATIRRRIARRLGFDWLGTWMNETTYGATVALGEPMPVAELPDDYDRAMDIVFARICALKDEARRATDERSRRPLASR